MEDRSHSSISISIVAVGLQSTPDDVASGLETDCMEFAAGVDLSNTRTPVHRTGSVGCWFPIEAQHEHVIEGVQSRGHLGAISVDRP
jgi:hypothetical protein